MARERKFTTEQLFEEVRHQLLAHGYESLTFGTLAEKLEVSRGTLYKYYQNKEDLISDYMTYEVDKVLDQFRQIPEQDGFAAQFDYLIDVIFQHSMIHQIMSRVHQMPREANPQATENQKKIDEFHHSLYQMLHGFLQLGRQEQLLNPNLPDGLILGMIFQTINIPNHFGIPHEEWISSIKEMLRHGMLTK
ncbi:TetR family transcriptional regulator [Tumebacillus avium]|uniref:TetR family transcriptional regulator n=1 Tax=Tumebacillus avium TaxID=1903704 RepID=A0A1Y0IW01_9BACL|nr:TetR/AcrR family transcriptional regulator [Tumebacillus avium]ARU63665.1 TetR family transcriptional regulator [Tumebacillus avium]